MATIDNRLPTEGTQIDIEKAIRMVAAAVGGGTASDVTYDGTSSGLSATNVQDAIDEVVGDIPTVNDATLTIQKNGTTIDTFTANSASNKTVNVTVPTATSDLNNDSDFVSDASYVHTDNNFTSALLTKLNGIESGAEVNVQSDWNEADNTADDYIKNKPNLATVATSGSYTDLSNTPTIPDELADLADDSTHRVVTDTQISTWNGKQDDVCLSVVDGKVCITYTV